MTTSLQRKPQIRKEHGLRIRCMALLSSHVINRCLLSRMCLLWQDDALLAYQIGFDLFENEMQSFLLQVRTSAAGCCTSMTSHDCMHHRGGQTYASRLPDPAALCVCKSSPILMRTASRSQVSSELESKAPKDPAAAAAAAASEATPAAAPAAAADVSAPGPDSSTAAQQPSNDAMETDDGQTATGGGDAVAEAAPLLPPAPAGPPPAQPAAPEGPPPAPLSPAEQVPAQVKYTPTTQRRLNFDQYLEVLMRHKYHHT